MKKMICLFLVICCILAGCQSAPGETEAATQAPAVTEAPTEAETIPETETPAALTISPLPVTVDVNQLDDCTAAVSLNEGDAYVDDTGVMQMKVTVYVYDLYDMVDISMLKEGDTIVLRGEDVPVTSLEWTDYGAVLINGGLDVGGYELQTDDSGVYYEIGYSDVKSWYSVGEATIRVSQDFQYTDSSDLDEGDVVYYPGDFLIEGTGIDYNFTPDNTTIVIEGGMVISMHRVYTP